MERADVEALGLPDKGDAVDWLALHPDATAANVLALPRLDACEVWQRAYAMKRDSRMVCGAQRRGDGQPCQALSVPDKRRCKWHGGCSTGPRTAEGKAKCATNLPRLDRGRG